MIDVIIDPIIFVELSLAIPMLWSNLFPSLPSAIKMADGKDGNKLLLSINQPFAANELLAYVQFYRNNSNSDNIKKVLINFYFSDEITSAKDTLWLFCGAHLGDKISRRSSTTLNQQDADLSDILAAFKHLDENNVDIPVFVPVKLDRLPKYGPEEINIFTLMDKMFQFEQSLLSAKNDIGLIKGDISAMKSKQPISAPTSSVALYCNVVALPPLSKGSSCERLSSNCSGNISDGGKSSSSHAAIANSKQKSCQSTNSTSNDSSSDKETDGFLKLIL